MGCDYTPKKGIFLNAASLTSNNLVLKVTGAQLLGIQITSTKPFMAKGNTQQLTAIGTYTDGTTADISDNVVWQSVDTKKVSVSSRGLERGVNTGTSNIRAKQGEIISNTLIMTVTSAVLQGNRAIRPLTKLIKESFHPNQPSVAYRERSL